jgi:prevent-host-death family protein
MKETTIEQLTQDPAGILNAAQRERILITRNGEPLAVVVGVEHKDAEDFRLEASPEFWQMIDERRRCPTIPLKDIETELFADDA